MLRSNSSLKITAAFTVVFVLFITGCAAPQAAVTVQQPQLVKTAETVIPPPVISNVRVSKTSDTTACITWGTDRPTTTEVTFWEEGAAKKNTFNDEEINTAHFCIIQPIQMEKTYSFIIKARDAKDPLVVSAHQGVFSIKTGSAVSQYAPDFKLPVLKGENMGLSQYLGRNVLLLFWDITCSACQKKMPAVQKVFSQLDSSKIALITVHVSGQEGDINSYCVDNGLTLPVLLDLDGKVGASYDITGIPAAFFIDKYGIILARNPEFNTEDELNKLVGQYFSK